MNIIAASPAPRSAPGKGVTLQFGDNALLPLLYGDHDRNLVRLEQGLGVRMSSRGNRVAISGDPERVQAAEQALTGLYKRLEGGKGLSRGDVDAAIRMADVVRADDGDPRLPLSDLPAILTRARSGGAALARAGDVYGDAGAARDGVRGRPSRHGQDLPRGRSGGGDAAGGPGGPDRAVAPGGGDGGSGLVSCRVT